MIGHPNYPSTQIPQTLLYYVLYQDFWGKWVDGWFWVTNLDRIMVQLLS
jgi:hypothetical protein